MAEKNVLGKLPSNVCGIDDQSRETFENLNDTQIFSPISPGVNANASKIDWLDQYVNAHRIAEENIEFMRKWILKIPLSDLLHELNRNYVGKMDAFSCEHDRLKIEENIMAAIAYEDMCYLIYAYTIPTAFYRQLNADLAKRGSTFRFESQISDRSEDDRVPLNMEEYIFTACVIHHPSVEHLYYPNCITYRGMNLSREQLEQYVPGARILLRSFVSTSKSVKVAKFYFNLISEDKIPVLCIYHITQSRTAMFISGISQFTQEEEVLLRPFAVFSVIKVEKASLEYDEHGRVMQIFLEELPSTTERWEISDNQLNKNSFTDLYDSQGRLTSIDAVLCVQ